jgi:hypothetical protein
MQSPEGLISFANQPGNVAQDGTLSNTIFPYSASFCARNWQMLRQAKENLGVHKN